MDDSYGKSNLKRLKVRRRRTRRKEIGGNERRRIPRRQQINRLQIWRLNRMMNRNRPLFLKNDLIILDSIPIFLIRCMSKNTKNQSKYLKTTQWTHPPSPAPCPPKVSTQFPSPASNPLPIQTACNVSKTLISKSSAAN